MKNIIKYNFVLLALISVGLAQEDLNPYNVEPLLLNSGSKLGRGEQLSDAEITQVSNLIMNAPMVDGSINQIPRAHIRLKIIFRILEETKNPKQKQKLAETMFKHLKKIQVMRNEIGPDPLDSRFLELHPFVPSTNSSPNKGGGSSYDTPEEIAYAKLRTEIISKINPLGSIYSYTYRKLKESKTVSLEGIPEKLEYIESAEAKKKRELNKLQQNVVDPTQETPSSPQSATKEIAPLTTPSEEKQQAQPIPSTKADTTNNDLNAERKIVSSNSQQQPSQPWLIAIAAGIILLLSSLAVVWWKKKRSV
jgi:hypothetical protein